MQLSVGARCGPFVFALCSVASAKEVLTMLQKATVKQSDLDAIRLIRWATLVALVGLSKSRIRQMEIDGTFPKRIALGASAVAWRYSEVKAWVESRKPSFAEDKSARLHAYSTKGTKRPTGPARRVKTAKRTPAASE